MAFQASDGSKWTNASQARRVPGKAQGDGKQPVSRFSKPEAEQEPETSQEPEDVAAEHGPADEVTIKHAEKHSVHSKHPDGHKHRSEHDSAEEAHGAAAKLAGVQPEQEQVPEPSQAMM